MSPRPAGFNAPTRIQPDSLIFIDCHWNFATGGPQERWRSDRFLAYLDTGASNCLFERRRAELLKLEIEAGDRRIFRTVIGGVVAFGHVVEIEVLGVAFESMVYFFADEWINKNLLGRIGWCTKGTLLRHSNPRIPVEPPQSVKYPLEKWRNCPRITG